MFWKFLKYTMHWDETQMLKNFPFGKINVTKNALFFLSTPHLSFSFNSEFLNELKHKVHLSETVCGILVFTKVYIIV